MEELTLQNNNVLTGAVMLETMWKTRKQDLLDLIMPFVSYGVAKVSAPHETIDLRRVLVIVKSEFGYKDMPVSVIERVIVRNPNLYECIQLEHGKKEYKLKGSLDSTVQEIKSRREECDKKISILGNQISDYLSLHISRKKDYSKDEGIQALQDFFSRNGAFLGTEQLEEHAHELKGYEEDYYIAQYLYEKRDQKSIEYDYVIDLVKGYFLQSAIYLQLENTGILDSTYKDLSVYYDTPFLLRLLGYKTEDDKLSSNDLHDALQKQRAKTFYFRQTQSEVRKILQAYKRDLGISKDITLEGLDEQRYSPADVERVLKTWEKRLVDEFDTTIQEVPSNNDNSTLIDENELRNHLRTRMRWHSPIGMDADIESIIAILNLRKGKLCDEIENSQAIFVTTNATLCKLVSEFYKVKVSESAFSPVITDSDLAALTWIKTGTTDSLPDSQLLRNAYVACQPTPEMLEKFSQVLETMQGEGKITQETVVAIRASRYTKKELLFASFSGGEGINESIVLKIEKMLREEYSNDARDDEKYKAELRRKKDHTEQLRRAEQNARTEAEAEMNDQLSRERCIVKCIGSIITIGAIIGLIVSLLGAFSQNILVILTLAIFIVFSIDSTYSTWKGTEKRIDKWLVKRANRTYDKVNKQRAEAYRNVIDGTDINREKAE